MVTGKPDMNEKISRMSSCVGFWVVWGKASVVPLFDQLNPHVFGPRRYIYASEDTPPNTQQTTPACLLELEKLVEGLQPLLLALRQDHAPHHVDLVGREEHVLLHTFRGGGQQVD
jgi:hypothetical protein